VIRASGCVLHGLLFVAIAALAACAPLSAPSSTSVPAPEPVKAADFEAAIVRFQQEDPQSPQMLNARLDYADFLSDAAEPDCGQKLTAAQSQLDMVAARPAIDVLLPPAPARIADGEYRIHLARATCGNQTPSTSELQQALEAAQQAVGLYRDAFDYQSAAIMQFNIAAAYQQLNDADNALTALETAVAMDRDYGFRKDAEDNTRLLLQWKNRKADDSDVAAAMKDFPARSANFKFNWHDSDADVALNVDETSLIQGKVIHSHGATQLTRRVRAAGGNWAVSNERGTATYDPGDWPADAKVSEWSMLYFIATGLLQTPGIEITRNGDFKDVPDAEGFGTDLARQISTQISIQVSKSGDVPLEAAIKLNVSPAFSPEGATVVRNLNPALSAGFIESRAAQDYGLQTATWIGAKLEQGVWHQMQTPLFLPGLGLGLYVAQHDISFAFTRQVPCTADAPDHLCAEIVVHAIPDQDDLRHAFDDAESDLKLSVRQSMYYWPRIDLRLVIDPDTLMLYASDMRQSWYDRVGKSEPVIEQVKTISTVTYH
jgi:tetratricopeptide (TPR) repeat protein